jgi:hypothetical protein
MLKLKEARMLLFEPALALPKNLGKLFMGQRPAQSSYQKKVDLIKKNISYFLY